ncbi:hypothetical protein ACROYT_G017670 [Oculina patagonica]
MTDTGEICKEARVLKGSLANPKIVRKIGCWNVRTMYSVGKTAQVTSEMQRYRLSILGISECRWSGFGSLRPQTGETNSSTQVYAPTNEAEDAAKDTFYDQLQKTLDAVPRHDMLLVIGRLERQGGRDAGGMFTSTHGPRQVVNTETKSTTWQSGRSLRGQSKTQGLIEELMWGTDHNLIITKVKLRLNSTGKKQEKTIRYEESKLRAPEVRQQFQLELRNRFNILQTSDQNDRDTDGYQNSKPSDSARNIE